MNTYIEDGYTANGFITEVPRLHSSLTFKYRPVMIGPRGVYLAKIEAATPQGKEEFRAEIIKRHVVQWDLKHKGEPVLIETAPILHLQPQLFMRLYYILMGLDATDAQESDATAKTLDAGAELDAALAGVTPAEADAKN